MSVHLFDSKSHGSAALGGLELLGKAHPWQIGRREGLRNNQETLSLVLGSAARPWYQAEGRGRWLMRSRVCTVDVFRGREERPHRAPPYPKTVKLDLAQQSFCSRPTSGTYS